MNEIKLKPCPFCGETTDGGVNIAIISGCFTVKYGVICENCGAEINAFDTEKEAVKAWNKRYEPPTPGGAIVPAGNDGLGG